MSNAGRTETRPTGSTPSGLAGFLASRHGAVIAGAIALVLAVAGSVAPLVIGEMRRQTAITETARRATIEFDDVAPARWGWLSPHLPERFQNVSGISFDDPYAAWTDYDFANLQFFPELRFLHILGGVSREQLLALPGLNRLETLVLSSDAIDDVAVRHLAKIFPNLKWLGVRDVSMTDASIRQIYQLEQLETLDLRRTKFHAKALEGLGRLKHLRALLVDASSATRAELDELRRVVPAVRVLSPGWAEPDPFE